MINEVIKLLSYDGVTYTAGEDKVTIIINDANLTKEIRREKIEPRRPSKRMVNHNGVQMTITDYLWDEIQPFNSVKEAITCEYSTIRESIVGILQRKFNSSTEIERNWEECKGKILNDMLEDGRHRLSEVLTKIVELRFSDPAMYKQLLTTDEIISFMRYLERETGLLDKVVTFCGTPITVHDMVLASKPSDQKDVGFLSMYTKGYNGILDDLSKLYILCKQKGIADIEEKIASYKASMMPRYQQIFRTSLRNANELATAILYNGIITVDPSVSKELFTLEEIVSNSNKYRHVLNANGIAETNEF